ncbi:unnamed protein product [Closterium sp. NIES-54]
MACARVLQQQQGQPQRQQLQHSRHSGATSQPAQLSFTLDSGASCCFFHDCTELTPLRTPVTVALADPSVGPVVAHSTTTLPYPAAPSGSLTGYYTPSFFRNLVSQSCLPHFLARLRRRALLASRVGNELPLTPCFPPPRLPFQTLHLDVWGPSPVLGPRQERYFLIVVDDYSRYTTIFPLRRKANVPTVLELWLLARGGAKGLYGLRLHLDRSGEFSSTRLETFCQGRGIVQSYTLPASPQQNEVAERRIGLVMEFAWTSMCRASAPQFLWPQGVRYAAHQLNLWPSDARPRVTPVSLWTDSPGVASDFCVLGSLAHVRAPGVNNLSPCTRVYVFLGFPLDASGWVIYDPLTYVYFSSQDVMFDESVCYYSSRPHRGVSHVTPQSSPLQRPVPIVSGGAGGAVAEGEGTGAVGAGGVRSQGVGVVGVEVTPVEDTAASSRRPRPASPPGFPSVPQFPPRSSLRPVAAEPGGVSAGGTRGTWGVGGGGAGSGGARARGTGTVAPKEEQQGQVLSQRTPREAEQQRLRKLPDPAPIRLVCGPLPSPPLPHIGSLSSSPWSRHSPLRRVVSPEPRRSRYRADGPFHLVLRSRDPPPPVLPQPPGSSLAVFHDLLSDYLRASRPVVSRVLSALVTHSTAPPPSVVCLGSCYHCRWLCLFPQP